ncbi:hypothetical protein AMTR_s00083p00019540 [Amborella trichopoda]|uniref:Uncharacterized protein n=1 Tax=Amborella trichopoda TaxID=13333 RepID=W1P694_AMBTC|nr:hypothetical protein AMTR_s00083p00019540 [Amborella trichopoda]
MVASCVDHNACEPIFPQQDNIDDVSFDGIYADFLCIVDLPPSTPFAEVVEDSNSIAINEGNKDDVIEDVTNTSTTSHGEEEDNVRALCGHQEKFFGEKTMGMKSDCRGPKSLDGVLCDRMKSIPFYVVSCRYNTRRDQRTIKDVALASEGNASSVGNPLSL